MAVRSSLSRPLLVIAGVLLLAVLPLFAGDLVRTFHIDFVAFRCAGAAVTHGRNPYLESSLHPCESAAGLLPGLTMPVPYPPYALPFFAALALASEPVAWAIWTVALIAATLAAARALAIVTGLPAIVTGSALCALVLVPSLLLGQVAAFALCAFALALLCLQRGAFGTAAAALAVSAILPNFALPLWIASFVCIPRMRWPLAAAAGVLVLLSVLVTNAGDAWTYVTAVLPAHGRSELYAFWQLGIPATLAIAGVPSQTSVVLGYVAYAAAILLGIAAGLRLRARFGGDVWILAAVAAFTVAGSPFVHDFDVGFALPLSLMLLAASPSKLTAAAAICIATPWAFLTQDTGASVAVVLPFLLVVAGAALDSSTIEAVVTVCAIAAVSVVGYRAGAPADLQLAAAHHLALHPALPPDALAEERWRAFADATKSVRVASITRLPTYLALALLLLASYRVKPAASASR